MVKEGRKCFIQHHTQHILFTAYRTQHAGKVAVNLKKENKDTVDIWISVMIFGTGQFLTRL